MIDHVGFASQLRYIEAAIAQATASIAAAAVASTAANAALESSLHSLAGLATSTAEALAKAIAEDVTQAPTAPMEQPEPIGISVETAESQVEALVDAPAVAADAPGA